MKCHNCQNQISKVFNCNFCSSSLCSSNCILVHFSSLHKNPVNPTPQNQSKPLKPIRLSSTSSSSNKAVQLHNESTGSFLQDITYDPEYSIENYTKVKSKGNLIILGSGTFGQVYLVKHIFNGKLYAIKHMSKDRLLQALHTFSTIHNEIDLHSRLVHKNIIRLVHVRETPKAFDLIMEAANGGSLFALIRRSGGLSEAQASNYFSQVLNAIHFLHEHNIIHRDIKPENILLDGKGIVKLCDFGWSIELSSRNRSTYCGTMEYMAPEIINKANYDKSIDLWSLGVLLYELLHGYSPFRAVSSRNDSNEVVANIKAKSYSIDKKGISAECKDLIANLLNDFPEKRLRTSEILTHPFILKHSNGSHEIVKEKPFTRQKSISIIDKDWINKKLNNDTCENKDMNLVKDRIRRHKSIQAEDVKERISQSNVNNNSCFEDILAHVDRQNTSVYIKQQPKRITVEEILDVTILKNDSAKSNKIVKVFDMKRKKSQEITGLNSITQSETKSEIKTQIEPIEE